MLILPVPTPRLNQGDDIVSLLLKNDIRDGDILVVSSKAVARIEGATIDLRKIQPTPEARKYAHECNQDPCFTQCVLDETKRMNGAVSGTCPFALLTILQPTDMKTGRILCPNAGVDQSNIEAGHAIGWPLDPVASIRLLQKKILEHKKYSKIGIILSDSCTRPGRLGVTAFALTCCGIDPFISNVGNEDLFGKKLRVTQEAVADQLATAANAVMGNAAQSIPVAIIRDHRLPSSDFCGWVPGIEPEEDLFRNFWR